jgi:ParB-like chromosome segregation protein Spo0J
MPETERARIPSSLEELSVPTDDLVPYERNPRHGNVELIAHSLVANGQYRPIVVRAGTNQVLAGNHTLAAARHLGWERIAATFVEVDDEGAARIVLADNRTADLGSYDNALLLDLLKDLAESDAQLAGTGYDDSDLDALVHLWGDSPDLDAVAEEAGEVTEADKLVRLALDVTPELREVWELHRANFSDDSSALSAFLDGQ